MPETILIRCLHCPRAVNGLIPIKLSPSDVLAVRQYRWHVNTLNYVTRRLRLHEFANRSEAPESRHVYLARELLGTPPTPDAIAGFRNGDHFDFRRENLFWITGVEAQARAKLASNNTSGVRGVYWNANAGKWLARVRKRYLGLFEHLEDAAEAVRQESLRVYGELSPFYEGESDD